MHSFLRRKAFEVDDELVADELARAFKNGKDRRSTSDLWKDAVSQSAQEYKETKKDAHVKKIKK